MEVSPFLFGETVLVSKYTAGAKDAYGKVKATYLDPVPVSGVSVQVTDSQDIKDGLVLRTDVDYLLFFPAGTAVGSNDKITVRGEVCTVQGVPAPTTSAFTGAQFCTEVKVKRS